jgi:hypothetical protein
VLVLLPVGKWLLRWTIPSRVDEEKYYFQTLSLSRTWNRRRSQMV